MTSSFLLPELILAVGAMAALLIGAVCGDKATNFLVGPVVLLMAVAAYFALTGARRDRLPRRLRGGRLLAFRQGADPGVGGAVHR